MDTTGKIATKWLLVYEYIEQGGFSWRKGFKVVNNEIDLKHEWETMKKTYQYPIEAYELTGKKMSIKTVTNLEVTTV